MSNKAAFTIVSRNYLGQVLALKSSFESLHNDVDFYVVLVDRKPLTPDPALDNKVNILWAEELGINNYWRECFKFDVIEWSTNVKPFVAKYLLARYEKVLYLDPDLYFYRNVDWLYRELDSCAAIVTPHATAPIYDDHSQGDLEWMRVGTFNLGFVGLARTEETSRLLDWWGERCLSDGFIETQRGVFVDQKWFSLAIGFFPGIRVLYHRGLNVASWNLHERVFRDVDPPELVDGTPVYFFHFSGFDPKRPELIHTRQKRWSTSNRHDLTRLVLGYAETLLEHGFLDFRAIQYSNDHFTDGLPISPLMRRVYALYFQEFSDKDPFAAGSDAYRYAKSYGLVRRIRAPIGRATASDLPKYKLQIRILDFAFSIVRRIVGPYRYFDLMKYLAHMSSVRSQRGVFRRPGQ